MYILIYSLILCKDCKGIGMIFNKIKYLLGGLVMLYPLKFHPLYKDYFWGGRELEKWGKKLPAGVVAESWEVSSHPHGESKVSNGEFSGMKLSKLTKEMGLKLVGKALGDRAIEKFPLLIKLIDANKKLSVQVHPKDEYARITENGELGKNEMWHVISARPGAQIVCGVSTSVTREVFISSIKSNKIENCLSYLEVFPGDTIYIPAGIIHSIGEGIVLAEIQQNSNITYRIYDYDRIDSEGNKRQLNIEKALEVIDFNNCKHLGKQKGLAIRLKGKSTKTFLITNRYFSVEKYIIDDNIEEIADGDRFFIFTCLYGEGQIHYLGGVESIVKGETILIPAALGEYKLKGKLQLIKSYVPNVEDNVIKPLLREGYTMEMIQNNVIGQI